MFAILFEVLFIEVQEEIHHFAGWEGGVKGHENCVIRPCPSGGPGKFGLQMFMVFFFPPWAPTLSGPLNRLNAILSLLQPLDRYRTPSAIGSAIGRPLSRPISHPNTGWSPQPPRSKPLWGLNRATVVL